MSARRLAAVLLVSVALTATAPASIAKKKNKDSCPDSSVLSQSGGFQSIPADNLDPTTGLLLWQLSHKPQLMNLNYLRYYLGEPDKQTSRIGVRSDAYYWYDEFRRPRCELYREHDQPGQVVESVMVVHLPPSDLDFALLEKKIGQPCRSFYDNQAQPTRMYSFAPNTSLSLSSPPNTFCIRKATITYIGDPLPAPAPEDMQIAHDSFIAFAQAKSSEKNENRQEALFYAKQRVNLHPVDADAHIALAAALQRTGNVHEAIDEYKLALSLNKYNDPVRQQCIQGLKDLFVLPRDFSLNDLQSTGIAGNGLLTPTH